MDRYFTRDFYKFFFGFVTLIAVAFGVMIGTSVFAPETPSTENIANPAES